MKPIIVFVGAFYYGNLGDDLYPEIIEYFLGDRYELLFFNSDLPDFTAQEDYLLENRDRIFKLVFGGGGLIYDDETAHREYMQHYSDFALKHAIPYGFTSIGIQRQDREDQDPLRSELANWRSILEQAQFIYCRHSWDCEYLSANLERPAVAHYPDLVYLLRYIYGIERAAPRRKAVVIADRWLLEPRYLEQLRIFIRRFRLVFLLFGQDDAHHQETLDTFSDGTGVRLADCVIQKDKNRREYLRHIAGSQLVVTGRYHGLVLARSLGVEPLYDGSRCPDKFHKEALICNPAGSYRNLVF